MSTVNPTYCLTRWTTLLYRKRKWQSLVCSAVNDLVRRGILAPIGGGERASLVASARFLPKSSGVRLIAKCPKREPLKDELLLLHYLKKVNFPESVDPKGKMLHRLWAEFASSVGGDLKKSGRSAVAYFATVDVRDAFDSVDLDKLNDILARLRSGLPESATVSHVMRHGVGGKKWLKEVVVTGDAATAADVGSRQIRPR